MAKHVPIRIWGRFFSIPKTRVGELLVEPTLRLRLVVDGVEANDALKENMEFRVR